MGGRYCRWSSVTRPTSFRGLARRSNIMLSAPLHHSSIAPDGVRTMTLMRFRSELKASVCSSWYTYAANAEAQDPHCGCRGEALLAPKSERALRKGSANGLQRLQCSARCVGALVQGCMPLPFR